MMAQYSFKPRTVRRFAIGVAVSVCVGAGAEQRAFGSVATIELVTVATPGPSNAAPGLPSSRIVFAPGTTFFVEVWAQTSHANGLSSVSADITFDTGPLDVASVTHTPLFGALTHGVIDNVNGLVNDLSGSHLGPCSDAVGVAPNWARVAVIQVSAAVNGTATIQSGPTNSPVYGTAICGVGDINPAQVSFVTKSIIVSDIAIPTVSEWGMIVLAFSLVIAAAVILSKRGSSDSARQLRMRSGREHGCPESGT